MTWQDVGKMLRISTVMTFKKRTAKTNIYACVYLCIYMCMYIYTYIYVHIYAFIHKNIYKLFIDKI